MWTTRAAFVTRLLPDERLGKQDAPHLAGTKPSLRHPLRGILEAGASAREEQRSIGIDLNTKCDAKKVLQ